MTRRSRTPIRSALVNGSTLHGQILDSLGAVKNGHRDYIDQSVRNVFADSLDLDAALQAVHPNDNRWDYLLGHTPTRAVIGLEPHSAKQDEVATVIAKRDAALVHLRDHLRVGVRIASWLWVASGKVHFADTEKERRRLDQRGITFTGTRVLEKHLPAKTRGAA